MRDESIKLVLSTADDGRTKDLRYRQRQFQSLHSWITGHTTEIDAALREFDGGMLENELRYLLTNTLSQLRRSYDSLDLKKDLAAEYSIKYGHDNQARRVPHLLIYVVPESHLLFFNVLNVLYACIAAGSCCVVEVSENRGANTDILFRVFREALDRSAFVIVHERPPVEVLSLFLVVDQSGTVPSDGLQRLLCSETSSPAVAVVDRTADLDKAAQEIAKSWKAFAGKSRYAPSYILVNEFVQAEFFELLRKYAGGDSLSRPGRKDISDHAASVKDVFGDFERTILKSPLLELIQISDRTKIWDPRRQHPRGRLIVSLATSSHDDAIDAVNASSQEAMLVLYMFAEPAAAKYLAQFIRTRVCFINHIATSMLVRPAAPVGYPVNPDFPYSRVMFEFASPQFVRVGGLDLSLEDLRQDNSKDWQKRFSSALQPLKPTGQPKEGQVNFFAQALVVGTVVYALPVFIMAVAGSVVLIKRFRQ